MITLLPAKVYEAEVAKHRDYIRKAGVACAMRLYGDLGIDDSNHPAWEALRREKQEESHVR